MNILLVGLSHQTAPVELRERLALDFCEPGRTYQDITRLSSLLESIYFSTCNRVEVLVTTETVSRAVEEIRSFLAAQHGLAPTEFQDCLYVLQAQEAVRHLFLVASSLDSMVVGEPQILGQLKIAFRLAVENKATGAVLNKLMHKSFSVAKRIRTETGIASHAVSISYAAVELARKIFGDLDRKRVLLIGAGDMAELAAEHLLAQGASRIVVANRTLERALTLTRRWDGQAAGLDEIPGLLAEVDIVISSTGAPELVVPADMVKTMLKARKHRPLFFVDIAVPRDIDPNVNRLGNVYLYDIDDLKGVVEENRAARSEEAVRARRIVEEETIKYLAWLEALDTVPTIVALKEKADDIRRAELGRTLARLGPLDPAQVEALEVMTESLTHKILHDPILFIKNAGRRGKKDFYLDLTRRVFALNGEAGSARGQKDKKPDQDT